MGWRPPDGWLPPPEWPAPPADWKFWVPEQHTVRLPVQYREHSRRDLGIETWCVMLAALVPWVISAAVALIDHLAIGGTLNPLPTFDRHQVAINIVLGLISYVPTAAVVPVVLLLLARTGQPPAVLGLTRAGWSDVGAATGLAAGAFACEILLAIVLVPLSHSSVVNRIGPLHVPVYYLVFGLSQALITSVAEETVVNGYLITRLDQLGWSPAAAFWLSMALRTSYHVYYGLGVLLTLPLGYFATRSFQRRRKLNRPILMHFLYDSTVFLIAILAH